MIREVLAPFVAGLLFALGLGLSQMTRPEVVRSFLAFEDPSLALVMLGAIAVHLGPTWWGLRRGRALTDRLHLPTATRLDGRLILGSVLFGAGWGLAAYCPGPALVATFAGSGQGAVLVLGLLLGMGAVNAWDAMSTSDHLPAQDLAANPE
ncbi:MAG: hypothetical protein EP330_03930 [Deltaproteobacteria bacterium]|nr:MAG: hypothetical protein EP330_03930 [Deltaproteobacteria bacterium]